MAMSAIPGMGSGESDAGNPAGSIQGTPTDQIDQMLKAAGIPLKGAPFMAFYFVIMVVIMGQQNKNEQNNIGKLSGQLNDMASTSRLWADVREAYMNVRQGPKVVHNGAGGYAKPTNPSADGTDEASEAFRRAIANFINRIAEPFNQNLPPLPGTPSGRYPPVNANDDGSPIDPMATGVSRFLSWVDQESKSTAGLEALDKMFPTFGRNIVQICQALTPLAGYSYTPASIWQQTWSKTWKEESVTVSNSKSSSTVQTFWQDPTAVQSDFDSLSNVEGITNGVSASESSKLQYAQNQYNRMMSFAKDMLNAWCAMRKAANGKMAQANN